VFLDDLGTLEGTLELGECAVEQPELVEGVLSDPADGGANAWDVEARPPHDARVPDDICYGITRRVTSAKFFAAR